MKKQSKIFHCDQCARSRGVAIPKKCPHIRDEMLTQRTCAIIESGGRILLRRGDWYLHQWTNIAAGTDSAHWGKRNTAMEMFDLKWAFAIAPLYKCKVVVVRPKKKSMP